MFVRTPEQGLFQQLAAEGIGGIAFSPLAQGLLSNRYLGGIPTDSRAGKPGTFLKAGDVTEQRLAQIRALNELAQSRGQSLAQMAIAWVLRQPSITSALIGASRPAQIEDIAAATRNLAFSDAELARIEEILK
jgi:L-glyceraldehyde 3-phosphate reductase